MIYKGIFDLQGTDQQQQIVVGALDQIKFPWHRLTPPNGTFVIGWQNLNGQQLEGKLHKGDHPDRDEGTDKIEGELEGRKYTMGVMYPSSGNMYIDNALVGYPQLAQTTVSAEVAHVVDFFMPLTDAMKDAIIRLMHPNGADTHTWWEKNDYSGEYYTLVGEAWMQAFTVAYSDMHFDTYGWTHYITPEQAPEIRNILGIQRTDYVAPAEYKIFGTSKTYHKLTHYPAKPGIIITDTSAYKPCKICKPAD